MKKKVLWRVLILNQYMGILLMCWSWFPSIFFSFFFQFELYSIFMQLIISCQKTPEELAFISSEVVWKQKYDISLESLTS